MVCRLLTGAFVALWLAGVASFVVNQSLHNDTLDLFTALVMTPLGLPWNLYPVFFGGSDTLRMVIALAAPLINLVLLWVVCRAVCRIFCRAGRRKEDGGRLADAA
ncbi:MAG TPA: hypothetical protein ENK15_06095 [Thermopetrobacter sp.]|nr:hypothetical protein [Thermopetrobacter sp.]